MGLIITEEYLQAAERMKNRVKQGVNIENGSEELNLDPRLVMELFKTPSIQVRKDTMSRRTYIVGMGLIPINLDDMVIMQVGRLYQANSYLHLELVEHSVIITDHTLVMMPHLEADSLIKRTVGQMEQLFESMYNMVWKDDADKASIMPFKIFRSKLVLELKEKYGIKNL